MPLGEEWKKVEKQIIEDVKPIWDKCDEAAKKSEEALKKNTNLIYACV